MIANWSEGEIRSFNANSGYGYLESDEGEEILVHSRSLGNGVLPHMIRPGVKVRFKIETVRTGLVARLTTPIEKVDEENELGSLPKKGHPRVMVKGIDARASISDIVKNLKTSKEYLTAAIVLKDQKRWNDARRVYKEGLDTAPSVQLVLSFAAFEKHLRQGPLARGVYKKGAALFRNDKKLYEDAGMLESKMGYYKEAIEYFEHALILKPTDKSRANIYKRLGDSYYKLATRYPIRINKKHLEKAKHCLENANRLQSFMSEDFVLLNRVNSIRIDSRALRCFELFEKAEFAISQVYQPTTSKIDFVIEPKSKELNTTYGLHQEIFVRYLLTEPRVADLRKIDSKLEDLAREERADPGLAFIIVKGTKKLMAPLGRRLESAGQAPTIVPLDHAILSKPSIPANYLRNILDQWLFRRDLYEDNFPVSGRHFFGRERQLKSLFTNVTEGHHVGIFGLRKVGKTSFLWRIRDKSDTDLVAYVDLLGIPAAVKNCDYVVWLLGNELAKDFGNKYPNIAGRADFEMFGCHDTFDKVMDIQVTLLFDNDLNLLRRLLSDTNVDPPPKIIVLIDEVERLLPAGGLSTGFEGYYDFFSYWRGQAQHYRDLVTVITGANTAITERAQWEGIDNPVYKFYKEEFFPPLDFHECSVMVRELGSGMGVRYKESALALIYRLTGGHPFITRRLCSRVCHRRPARPLLVDARLVRDTIPDFMRQDSSLFDEILERLKRDFAKELQVLEFIAEKGEVTEDDIKEAMGRSVQPVLHHLIGYQLVWEKDGRFEIGLKLLKEFMIR